MLSVKKWEVIESAYEIAVNDLRANYGKKGIYAGPRNHHEYWARDAFFASLGSLSLGDYRIVKKNLELFISYQSPLGHIPLRIEERYHAFGLIGITIKHKVPHALFKPSQPWAGEVIDSNPLFLLACADYVRKTKDYNWMTRHNKAIMNAVSFLVGKFNQFDLVEEGINSGWADFTFKRGSVLYTNILVWRAFKLLCEVLPENGANYCIALTGRLEKSIRKNLWYERGGYFIDHIGKHGYKHRVFASDGNLLSVFFNFATPLESERIVKFLDTHSLAKVPVPIYFQGLEWRHRFLNYIFFPNYNTDYTFLWWGCLSAICRSWINDFEGARKALYNLSKIIVKYQTTPEIVDRNGKMLNKWYYKSERQAAWTAGTFVYAYNFLKNKII